ncbi:class I SAM-dependent methyltransferase [Streptomyces sp. NPDC050418]|uniref:class I SAM-dependent methyltransferase n=1 Tax=Streptomyces sp. NPDC050418 TaxID=3365612 RepID=UPI003788E2B7
MSTQLYDGIGEAFEGFKALPLAQYGEVPSVLSLVGDVTGKSVLDLASGTGFYSREFKRRGATDVLGIDISGEMIAVSQRLEDAAPLGVRYEVGDAAGLRDLGERFDLAVGVQLLHYAEDEAAMERMCAAVHRSLKPGGEFIILNQSPDFRFDGPSIDKYGFRSELTGEEAETGPLVRLTAHLPDHPVSFVTARPRREVFERSLAAAGFRDLTWVPLHISDEGIEEYGEEFWADLFVNPPLELARCRA